MLVQRYREEKERKEWALVSRKVSPKTGKRRVLYWFGTRKPSEEAFKKQEQRVQYFKHTCGSTYPDYSNHTFRINCGDEILLLHVDEMGNIIKFSDQKTGKKYKVSRKKFDDMLLKDKSITVLAAAPPMFHCTDNWVDIKRQGFEGKLTPDDIKTFSPDLESLLGIDIETDAYGEPTKKGIRDALAAWNKQGYNKGTIIWLSSKPNYDYGSLCLKIKPPQGSKVIFDNQGDEPAYWIPMQPIPFDLFEVVANKGSSALAAKQVGALYHHTSFSKAMNIINTDTLMASFGEAGSKGGFISTTRNKRMLSNGAFGLGGVGVVLVLDGDKLSNNYEIVPWKYSSGFDVSDVSDEDEERIIGISKIPNIKSFITEVKLYETYYDMAKMRNSNDYRTVAIRTFQELEERLWSLEDYKKKIEEQGIKCSVIPSGKVWASSNGQGFVLTKSLPRSLYFGSPTKVTKLDASKGRGIFGDGLYLTPDIDMAKFYAEGGRQGGGSYLLKKENGFVYKVIIKPNKVLKITDSEKVYDVLQDMPDIEEEVIDAYSVSNDFLSVKVTKFYPCLAEDVGANVIWFAETGGVLTPIEQILVLDNSAIVSFEAVDLKATASIDLPPDTLKPPVVERSGSFDHYSYVPAPLQYLAKIESNNHKSREHTPVKIGVHIGTRSVSSYGLMPKLIIEIAQKYGPLRNSELGREILDADTPEEVNELTRDQQIDDKLANMVWDYNQSRLKSFATNPEEAELLGVLAHRRGVKGAQEIFRQGGLDKVKKDPYIVKYLQAISPKIAAL